MRSVINLGRHLRPSPASTPCLRFPNLLPASRRYLSDATPSNVSPTVSYNKLAKIIQDSIKATGPLTVAQYTQLCLSHPTEGYYMKGDVFGTKGDFVTSPEISQVFGELIGIWLLSQWLEKGQPSKVRLIELGPGRGTLMDDILRTTRRFPKFAAALTAVHLVENSEMLRKEQGIKLESHGVPLTWHDRVDDIEEDGSYSLLVAHEFFDALPIHILRKTEQGFREVMIDREQSTTTLTSRSPLDLDTTLPFSSSAPTLSSTSQLRFTLAPGLNPTASVLAASSPRFASLPVGSQIEISPISWTIANRIGGLLDSSEAGGAGLFIDYGDDRSFADSFRAFKKHKPVGVFDEPGFSDLTANVDFAYLREAMSQPGLCHGLMPQRDFLLKMGVEVRLQALLSRLPDGRQSEVQGSVSRLIDPLGMGTQYQFMAVVPGKQAPYPFSTK